MPMQCLELCKGVIRSAKIRLEHNACGVGMYICDMCHREIEDNGRYVTLDNFPHYDKCPYILAEKILGVHDEEDEEAT